MILKAETLPAWHREDLDLRDYDPDKVMDFIINPANQDYWEVHYGQEGLDRMFQHDPLAKVGAVNWTQILQDGGIPEAPGYQETVELMKSKPKPVVKKKKKR